MWGSVDPTRRTRARYVVVRDMAEGSLSYYRLDSRGLLVREEGEPKLDRKDFFQLPSVLQSVTEETPAVQEESPTRDSTSDIQSLMEEFFLEVESIMEREEEKERAKENGGELEDNDEEEWMSIFGLW